MQDFMFTLKTNYMNMKQCRLIIVFIVVSVTVSAQADTIKSRDLEFRLKKIEEYRSIDDKKFENKSKELDLRIEEYRQQKTILDWVALAVGGLTIISLWGLWQKARAIAEKKIEEKFDTLLNDKKQQLIKIIDSHDKEHKLKRSNKIHVVASEKADLDFLLNFFKKLDFDNPTVTVSDTYQEIGKQEKYDLLLLFREEGNAPLMDDVAKQYMDNSRTDAVVFIFGKHIDLGSIKLRSSSATFWSQLYGNLLSALKYQELID